MSKEEGTPRAGPWTPQSVALVALLVVLLTLVGISITQPSYAEPLLIHATYYFLMVTVVCWASSYLYLADGVSSADVWCWVKENLAGILIALAVTVIAGLAIQPALRILADEANLLGTSKNFFFSKTATFTTSGKYYYDNFWDGAVVIDRRPTLFPFLVSFVHILRGYSHTNVFLFNLIVLPLFVLAAYRLAKVMAGELFGIVAALLVLCHPITLISVRSGGFDFLATFLAILVLRSFLDHSRAPSPERLAVLWMNLCVFAEARYESALFLPLVVILLLIFGLMRWKLMRPFALIYALTPVFLLPRIWQSVLLGNVPQQDPDEVTLSVGNFFVNSRDYFKTIFSPVDFQPPYSAIIIALGVVGCILWLRWFGRRLRGRDWKAPNLKFSTLVLGWMVMQMVIVFTFHWGRALHPSASRLVISIDTFFSFAAAWILVVLLRRWRPFVTVLLAGVLFAIYLPVASEYRILNELILTRQASEVWRYFASLHEKRILIVDERPGLFTIMQYGAVDFESARDDPSLLEGLKRHLYYDIYLVQHIDLTTGQPVPQHQIWPDQLRTPVLEFQNDVNTSVRISRLVH